MIHQETEEKKEGIPNQGHGTPQKLSVMFCAQGPQGLTMHKNPGDDSGEAQTIFRCIPMFLLRFKKDTIFKIKIHWNYSEF